MCIRDSISFGKKGTSQGKVKTHLYFKRFAQFSAEYIPDYGPRWPTNLSLIISNPNLENLSKCSLALIAIGKLLFEIFLIILEIKVWWSINKNALLTLFILEDFPPANITQGYLTFSFLNLLFVILNFP